MKIFKKWRTAEEIRQKSGGQVPIMEGKTAPRGAISAFAASGGGLEELMELNAKSVDRKLLLELSGEVDHHGARDAIRQLELAVDAALPP